MHTCRQWCSIILESLSSLQLHLYFTHGKPIEEMLKHLLPLPLFIDYGKAKMSTKDKEEVLLTLQHHHDCIHLINLHKPALQKLVVVMGKCHGLPPFLPNPSFPFSYLAPDHFPLCLYNLPMEYSHVFQRLP